jgi:biopolymer transport protein ExbB/TolQ
MSRATRTAGESRRGMFASAISYTFGVPAAFGLLHLIDSGMFDDAGVAHYTRFPVQKTAVMLFCCAVCGLAGKLLRYLRERVACAKSPLPEWDGKPMPPAQVGALQQQLALQPASAQSTFIGRRVRAVLDFVACRGSANDLDDQIRCLSDNDAIALEGSYALLRFITWAIPIIGFLGTVLGITGAISNIDPAALASDTGLTGVTQGLSEAFDTTALALFLTMILMFLSYLVERLEQGVLASVDRYVDDELTHRFARTRSEAVPGNSAGVDQHTQVMLGATQQLVEKQVALWGAAVEKTEQLGSKQQERMATAIGQALEFALTRYGKRLAEMEEGLLTRNQALIASVGQLANALRDTGREHQLTLARLIDGLGAQVETLTKVQTGEAELLRVQELLGQNLALLAGANTFEQAVQSLSAAVHMLTARAAAPQTPQTPALRIAPRSGAA